MRPATSKRNIRRYAVYDFEWVPGTLQLRVAGLYDQRGYHAFHSIESFLDTILIPENNGKWFFAHYGGNADVQFVLEQIVLRPQYHLSAIFSGSAAIMVVVKHKKSKHRWVFLDSFWLMRSSLDSIGKKIGLYKGGPTEDMNSEQVKDWYATVPLPELTDYNEQDCLILKTALEQLEQTLLSMGGQLRITIASTALDLFLRKYLKTELPIVGALNRWSRQAYIASRVEVLQHKASSGNYYDINSSFPYSMTKSLPGKIARITSTLRDSTVYLADATVTVPEDIHIPPLPYRDRGRIFFPTGTWRSYFFQSDIQALEEAGGSIDKVGDVIEFEPFDDLANYVYDVYERKKNSDGFERQIYKYLQNSLYGKFAEGEEKQTLHINPSLEVLERLKATSYNNNAPDRSKMIRPGMWLEKSIKFVDHAHVALSAAITSLSRLWIWQWMTRARECYYCDTDGIAVSADTEFPTSNELGDMKLEKVFVEGEFLQPKLYRLRKNDGKTLYKAKGFSLGKTDEEREINFTEIANGRTLNIDRMRRIRENLSYGSVIPVEVIVPKKIQNPVDKRCFFSDGTSRPWTVEEIEEL